MGAFFIRFVTFTSSLVYSVVWNQSELQGLFNIDVHVSQEQGILLISHLSCTSVVFD